MANPKTKNPIKSGINIWDDTNKEWVASGDIEAAINKLIGFEIGEFNYIALTYVTSGDGIGEIETVVYKTGGAGGTTVATLTLTYDANDKLSTVTKT